jgi:alkaline phosphatase
MDHANGRLGMTFNPMMMLRICILVLSMLAVGCAGARPAQDPPRAPRNIILLFADGVGSTQWEFGRYSSLRLRKQPFAATDIVFTRGSLGLLTTHSASAMVTDSAAAATAMSTGAKTDHSMIAVTPDRRPVRTALESAKAEGKRIGLVTTSAVYDASPAAFSVHAASRGASQSIVDQYLTLEPDVLLGAGADYFLPTARSGAREDGKDMIAAFATRGYSVARTTEELRTATGGRLLGLFTDDVEMDRDSAKKPSVAEMTAAALRALSPSSPGGVVLFVESEDTDTAGHCNDIAALMRALWAFDDALRVALEFQRDNPDTLIIVTGDHETGGLSVTAARRDPGAASKENVFVAGDAQLEMIGRITRSLDTVANELGEKPSPEALDRLLTQHFPGFRLDADLREIILEQRQLERNFTFVTQNALSRMVSRQTGIYWGTSWHTSEPAVVGALGPGAEAFRGYQDNTDFARKLRRLLRRRSEEL